MGIKLYLGRLDWLVQLQATQSLTASLLAAANLEASRLAMCC